MKSSKKFITRVLTAALALSMVAGTGVCAAAVEDTEQDGELVVIAPADETNDLSDRLAALKEMLSEAAQNAYAKLSQTTLAKLAKINQKIKAADEIMANAKYRDAELKINLANQIAQIEEDAEKLIASADYDEEFEAQIMAAVQEKVEQLIAETETQIAENMETAEAESNALLEEANAELEAIKADLQDKTTKAAEALKAKVDAIQQQVAAVKEQAEAAAQQAKDALNQTAIVKLVKAELKTKMAEKIMEEAQIQDAEIKIAVAEQVSQIRIETDELIAAIGDDEEFIAGIQEQIDQKVEQILDECTAQLDQIWADAEEQAGALLAEAEELNAEAQAQIQEETAAVKEMLAQKAAEIQAKAEALKVQIETQLTEVKAKVTKFVSDIQEFINSITTKMTVVDEGEFSYMIYSNRLTNQTTAVLIDYTGDETELDVPAYTEEGIPVTSVFFSHEMALTTLNLPATINDIDGLNIMKLIALETINVDEENPDYQSIDGVVFSKDGLWVYAVPQAKEFNAPEGVTMIMKYAYFGSQMEEIVLPSTLTTIDEGAFSGCTNLSKLEIPAEVSYIGKEAFAGTAEDFTIYCDSSYSYAVEYAQENGIKYVVPLTIDVSIRYEDENAYETGAMVLGTSVSFSAEGVGGSGDYTYAFYTRKDGDTKWTCRQGFKDNAAITLTPEFTGNYEICVKVKDSAGNVAKVYPDLLVLNAFDNTTTISAETIKKGKTVTVNCSAAGVAEDEVIYGVYYKKTTDKKWVTKQDYDENTEVTIKPAKAADYIICVKAKNINDGTISKKYFNVKVEA